MKLAIVILIVLGIVAAIAAAVVLTVLVFVSWRHLRMRSSPTDRSHRRGSGRTHQREPADACAE